MTNTISKFSNSIKLFKKKKKNDHTRHIFLLTRSYISGCIYSVNIANVLKMKALNINRNIIHEIVDFCICKPEHVIMCL